MSIKGIRYGFKCLTVWWLEIYFIPSSLPFLSVVSVSSTSAAASSTSTTIQTTSRSTSPRRNSAVGEDTPLDVSVLVCARVLVRASCLTTSEVRQ